MKNYTSEYDGQVATGQAGYPYGKPRNATTPGDETATPLDAAWVSDVWGWMQALLVAGGETPDGESDGSIGSQLWTAQLAGQGLISSRDPRWLSMITPGPGYDDAEALNQMMAELQPYGTLLLLPAPGASTAEFTVVDTLQIPTGATVIVGPGVTLSAAADGLDTPIITVDALARLLGPGSVSCALDTARKIVCSGIGGKVAGLTINSALVEVTSHYCTLEALTGQGAIRVTGDDVTIRACALAPTAFGSVCEIASGADRALIFGCDFRALAEGVMGGARALTLGGAAARVIGCRLRVEHVGNSCFGGGSTSFLVSGCTLSDGGVGSAAYPLSAAGRVAGCAGGIGVQEPVRCRGAVTSGGTLSNGARVASVSKSATGSYLIAWDTGAVASGEFYSVVVNSESAQETKVVKLDGSFRVLTYGSTGTAADHAFDFALLVH